VPGASCIALVTAVAALILPADSVTLSWTHTVERTAWEEDYLASPQGLILTEARIEAIGAGMEPPAQAVRDGRWWRYRPSLPPLPSIELANSELGEGYSICWGSGCRRLRTLVGPGEPVAIETARCPREGTDPAPIVTR
jgi:hypothetical protein